MNDDRSLGELLFVLAPLSLLAIGGGNSILGDLQNQAVQHGWLTPKEFQEMFAISRVAPGPGTLIVTLLGWRVAGWLGALVATLAIVIPSSLAIYSLARVWHAGSPARWHRALSRGLAPIAAGLILTSAFHIVSSAEDPYKAGLVAICITALAFAPRIGHVALLIAGTALFVGLQLI
jgi:chromate transporter